MDYRIIRGFYPKPDKLEVEVVARFVSFERAKRYAREQDNLREFERYWVLERQATTGKFKCIDHEDAPHRTLTQWLQDLPLWNY